MPKLSPSIPDLSAMNRDEELILTDLRELEMMSGLDASPKEVERLIRGIRYTLAALTEMARMVKEDPAAFEQLSKTTDYIGSMLWEWYLRRTSNEEMLEKVTDLGRSAAIIGHGIFPLDDQTGQGHA